MAPTWDVPVLFGIIEVQKSVTGTSGTAILRLGHVQKFCQKF